MIKRITSALLLTGIIACTPNQQDTTKSKETIVLSSTRAEKSLKQPNGGEVSFVYQYLEESPTSPLSLPPSTWKTVRDSVLFYFDGPTEMDSLSDYLFQNYETIIQDFPDYSTPWYAEIVESEHYNSPEWLGITLYVHSFMGGAHPNESFYFIHINPQNGNFFTADSLFTSVDDIAEKVKASLESKGLSLEVAPSVKNFRYSRDSVTFFYNPYEVAPYSEGPLEVSYAWSELTENLR